MSGMELLQMTKITLLKLTHNLNGTYRMSKLVRILLELYFQFTLVTLATTMFNRWTGEKVRREFMYPH